jgi:hypothetical protein
MYERGSESTFCSYKTAISDQRFVNISFVSIAEHNEAEHKADKSVLYLIIVS